MGDELLLGGQAAVPTKLTNAGFVFDEITIDDGLRKSL
jgi:NAD dependent epimerase/dehydratase family enzyme